MKKMNNVVIACLFLFIINSIVSVMIYIYDKNELYSGYVPQGEILSTENVNLKDAYMLSYGPYHELRSGYYLVLLSYKTDTENNTCSIYSDQTSVLCESTLNKNKTQKIFMIKKPGIKLQILTMYSGKGTLQVNGVLVLPLNIVIMSLVCFCLIILSVFSHGKRKAIFNKLTQAITMILLISTMFHVDSSASSKRNTLVLSLLFLIAIISLFYFLWDTIRYREVIFILSFTVCWIIVGKNIINYDLNYTVLFLSASVACFIFSLCYLFVKKTIRYCVTIISISTFFVIYSTVQYAYYTYFKDLFTIKVIKLAFTAMEASSSIKELINIEVLSYLIIGGIYFLAVTVISLGKGLKGT